ncbi:MAG: YIP1 family protein [Archaeoglobaceae archaeon]|nr:YIP1 family protein [Archaeoglobaceae archaeon]MDW8118316.1 YIP1 family protein [Archaeoglobaceae archaeon]
MDILVNPDKFFSERKTIGFKLPFVLVLVSAIIATFTAHLSSDTVLEIASKEMRKQGLSESEIEMFKSMIYASTVVAAFVVVFVGWVVITLVLYGLSAIFKGKGSFGTLMKFVAFSYIPVIILSPITIYLGYESFVMRNPEALTISVFFGMVLYVWQSVYWVFALKNARELSMKHSAIASAIVLILFLSASIYTLLQPSLLEMLR